MTRVDQEGIPCIVQSIDIDKVTKEKAHLKVALFDGSIVDYASYGLKFTMDRSSLLGFMDDYLDNMFNVIEKDIVNLFNLGSVYNQKQGRGMCHDSARFTIEVGKNCILERNGYGS